MRSISGTLVTAQQSVSAVPYLRVTLTHYSGAPTYTFTTKSANAIFSIRHIERPFGGEARILIKNQDNWFTPKDLRGYKVTIGYGYTTGGGDEYSQSAPLWVMAQQDVSQEGELLTELVCVDIFQKFGYFGVGPDPDETPPIPRAPVWPRDKTIHAIIDQLIASIDPFPALGALTVDSNDGIVDTFSPHYETYMNQPTLRIIQDMMGMTKSALRMETDGLHLRYLNPSDPVQYTYDTAHAFFSDVRQKSLVLPNQIIYVDHFPTDPTENPQYWAIAEDADSIARFGRVPKGIQPPDQQGVGSTPEAQQLADAALARLQADSKQARVLVPHNVQQELFDMVRVIDSRSGANFTGRIGGLIHEYQCGEAASAPHTYTLEVQLGGLSETFTTQDIGQQVDALWGVGGAVTDQPAGMFPSRLLRGEQFWHTNLTILPGNSGGGNKHDAIHWASGYIYWAGYTLAINAGQVTGISGTIYLYWDLTSSTPAVLKSTSNMADVAHPRRGLVATAESVPSGDIILITTPETPGYGGLYPGTVVTSALVEKLISEAYLDDDAVVTRTIAENAVAQGNLQDAIIGTDQLADLAVIASKIVDGTITTVKIGDDQIIAPKIAAGQIAVGHIVVGGLGADAIAANAILADKIAANQILTDHIISNAIETRHLQVGSVTAFQIRALNIGSGHLQADSVIAGKIDANAITAREINVGILSAITANLGTVTAGIIQAGSGGVRIRSALYFEVSAGVYAGIITPTSGVFEVAADPGYNLVLRASSGSNTVVLSVGNEAITLTDADGVPNLLPWTDGQGYLGIPAKIWGQVAAAYVRFGDLIELQHLDDVGAIRKAKGKPGPDGTRVIDTKTLPEEVRVKGKRGKPDLIDSGAMQGLLMGAIKQLAEELDDIKKRIGE